MIFQREFEFENFLFQIFNRIILCKIIWSAGLILYEMIMKTVLFMSHQDQDLSQIVAICQICGPLNSLGFRFFSF